MQTETTIEACGAKLTVSTEALFKAWLQQQFAPAVPVTHFGLPALAEGEVYAGVILTEDGRPSHHLVLLPGESEDINHADAIEWAKSISGELPTRNEQSLLFANAKKHFEQRAYWSQELHSEDGWAWCQYFSDGYQGYDRTSHALRARAVRRLPI
ncbi:DUF1566 domain-containing protein [Herbaspirillum robiniae]|uniref:DUF1566 domain-containing protein n=1 Tax=Herbaspirillum robiniae TaxID=2014887 RepID=UPI001EDB36A5|nr:DUF1566 domain-containing protein [Herbaspirillum robiniae]